MELKEKDSVYIQELSSMTVLCIGRGRPDMSSKPMNGASWQ